MGVLETGVAKEELLKLEWKSEGGGWPAYPCPYDPVLLEKDMNDPVGEDGNEWTVANVMAEISTAVWKIKKNSHRL